MKNLISMLLEFLTIWTFVQLELYLHSVFNWFQISIEQTAKIEHFINFHRQISRCIDKMLELIQFSMNYFWFRDQRGFISVASLNAEYELNRNLNKQATRTRQRTSEWFSKESRHQLVSLLDMQAVVWTQEKSINIIKMAKAETSAFHKVVSPNLLLKSASLWRQTSISPAFQSSSYESVTVPWPPRI